MKKWILLLVSVVIMSLTSFGCSNGANPTTTASNQTTSPPITTAPPVTTTASAALNVTLTVVIEGGGQTTPAPGTYTYQKGSVVNLAAMGDIHWTFNLWLGTVADTHSATTTITLNADQTVTAYFSAVMD